MHFGKSVVNTFKIKDFIFLYHLQVFQSTNIFPINIFSLVLWSATSVPYFAMWALLLVCYDAFLHFEYYLSREDIFIWSSNESVICPEWLISNSSTAAIAAWFAFISPPLPPHWWNRKMHFERCPDAGAHCLKSVQGAAFMIPSAVSGRGKSNICGRQRCPQTIFGCCGHVDTLVANF